MVESSQKEGGEVVRTRVFSAVIYLLVLMPLLFTGGWVFNLFSVLLALIIFSELLVMKGIPIKSFGALIGYLAMIVYVISDSLQAWSPIFSNANILIVTMMALLIYMLFSKLDIEIDEIATILFGLFYIGTAFQTFVFIREIEFLAIFFILVVIWATDVGAYIVGKAVGKRPLAPSISPNKTIEGGLGGIVIAVLASLAFRQLLPLAGFYPNTLVVILMSISGQMGDLVESAIKRHYQVKDSGDVLPGHGGLFDRFDSLIFLLNLVKLLMDLGIFIY